MAEPNSVAFPGRPAGIRAPHGARILEITWPGHSEPDRLPHEILRGYCPCAGCQGHRAEIKFQAGHDLEIRDLSPVGNYALCFTWGDGHATGIYSFEYLWRLARLLEEHGAEQLEQKGILPR